MLTKLYLMTIYFKLVMLDSFPDDTHIKKIQGIPLSETAHFVL